MTIKSALRLSNTFYQESSSIFNSRPLSPILKTLMVHPSLINGNQVNGHFHPEDPRMLKVSRDFRSDTFTAPTDEMFEVMKQATRGDDVYGEDETTNEFQAFIAQLTGKEAALFASSGTMTNQIALRSLLIQPPHSVLCDIEAHIHCYEAGGIAYHSQANTLAIKPRNGYFLTLEDDVIPNIILSEDQHVAPTRVIALENTKSGMVYPQEEVIKISQFARANDVKMHLDGARLWEVAAKTGISLKELCEPFDTVSLCLSKGLGAPIGSIVVGPKDVIKKAHKFRKLFGGATRQSGSLTAAAKYCIDHHWPRMTQGHALASKLAIGLHELGARIMLPVQTNMVFMNPSSLGFDTISLRARAAKLNPPITLQDNRLVIQHQTSPQAVEGLLNLISQLKAEYGSEAKAEKEDWWEESEAFAHGKFYQDLEVGPMKARKMIKHSYGR